MIVREKKMWDGGKRVRSDQTQLSSARQDQIISNCSRENLTISIKTVASRKSLVDVEVRNITVHRRCRESNLRPDIQKRLLFANVHILKPFNFWKNIS